MRVSVRIWVVALVLAGGAAATFAQNLVANPEFDSLVSISPWVLHTGSWSVGPDATGCVLSGSASGTSATVGGGQYLAMYSECIPVDGATTPTLWLGELYQTGATVFARMYLDFWDDTTCGTTFLGFSGFVATAAGSGWQRLLGSVSVPAATQRVRFWIDFNPQVSGIPQYTAAVDQVYLGVEPLLFADGAEADGGSVCRWSAKLGVAP